MQVSLSGGSQWKATPQLDHKSDSKRWLRVSLFIYVCTIILQEARLGPSGLSFPTLTVGVSDEVFGTPFIGEWAIALVLVITAVDVLSSDGHVTRRERDVPSLTAANVAWCIVVTLMVATLSVPQGEAAFGATRMLVEGFVLLFAVHRLDWNGTFVRRLLAVFLFVGCVHGAVIVISHYSPGVLPFDTNVITGTPERYAGMFMQPSRAALLMGLAFIVATGFALSTRSLASRLLACFGMAIGLTAAWLTQTRGVLAAIGVATVVLVIESLRAKTLGTGALIRINVTGLAIGLFLAGSGVVQLALSRFDDDVSAGTSRSDVYLFSLALAVRHPFGVGVGGFEPASGNLSIPHAHNMYLQWWVMFGILGLLLFLLLIRRAFRRNRRVLFSSDELEDRHLRSMLQGCFVFFGVAFLFEPYLLTNVGGWFWIVIGLMAARGLDGAATREGRTLQQRVRVRS